MRLSSERYEEIIKIIVNLFEKNDVNCVPVSGFELATKLGIKIIPYSSKDDKTIIQMLKFSEDGFFIEDNKNQKYIYYNDTNNYGRINNTIFHEIGHIVLGHTEESELAEAEVNFFAKYALVPPPLVHKYNLNTTKEISETFAVSLEAARYALNYYNKWLVYGGEYYKDFEIRLLNQFAVTVQI